MLEVACARHFLCRKPKGDFGAAKPDISSTGRFQRTTKPEFLPAFGRQRHSTVRGGPKRPAPQLVGSPEFPPERLRTSTKSLAPKVFRAKETTENAVPFGHASSDTPHRSRSSAFCLFFWSSFWLISFPDVGLDVPLNRGNGKNKT